MPSNFLGMYPKTSYRVFNPQPSQARPQVHAGANRVSQMAVYQDAYRKAEALLREKEKNESVKDVENRKTTQVDHRVTYEAVDDIGVGSETRLSETSGSSSEYENDFENFRGALAEAKRKGDTVEGFCAKYEEKIVQLTNANASTLSDLENAQIAVEQHRRISANLNLALLAESAGKQVLERELSKLKRSLEEASKTTSQVKEDHRASERKFKEATEQIVSLRTHLDCAACDLAALQAVHIESESSTIVLRSQIDTLSANYDKVAFEKLSLERVLAQAQLTIEKEMTCASETLTTLCLEREKNKALEQKLKRSDERAAALESELDDLRDNENSDDTSDIDEFHFSASTFELELEREMYQSQEQEALGALEAEKAARLVAEEALDSCRKMLLDSDALLAASNARTAALEFELDSLMQVEDTSCDGSDSGQLRFSASTFELELEREMYRSQEQKALAALEAEKQARRTAEVALDTWYKMLGESNALLSAANERTATLESELENLRDIEDLSDETDDTSKFVFNASTFELELEREIYRIQEQEALEALEAEKEVRLAAEKDQDLFRENQQLAFAVIEGQEQACTAATKDRDGLATLLQVALTTISELASSTQAEKDPNATIYAPLATECDARVRTCHTLQSVRTNNKATPKYFDMVQRQYLHDSNVSPASASQMATPARFTRADKENEGVVLQTSSSMRCTHFAFGNISMCDPPSLAWQPIPNQEAATQSFWNIDYPNCFASTQSDVASEFTGDNYDGVTVFGMSSPALS
ncbi:hypothetical protein BC835DRAFT_1417406 [Cytidiella melzeri]|nr:hypothetical protein BC835DRAFT_1417406 [Cytidiella melzeri]